MAATLAAVPPVAAKEVVATAAAMAAAAAATVTSPAAAAVAAVTHTAATVAAVATVAAESGGLGATTERHHQHDTVHAVTSGFRNDRHQHRARRATEVRRLEPTRGEIAGCEGEDALSCQPDWMRDSGADTREAGIGMRVTMKSITPTQLYESPPPHCAGVF